MGRASFHRARRFAPRWGDKPGAWFLGAASAGLLVCVLLLLGWIAELLFTGGDLRVPLDQRAAVEQFTTPANRTTHEFAEFENRGLLPVVWRLRNTVRGDVVGWLYDRLRPLRANVPGLLLLLAAGVAATALRSFCIYQSNRLAYDRAEHATWQLRGLLQRQALHLEGFSARGWRETNIAELFDARMDDLRAGLVAWWQAIPRAVLTLAALVALALWMQAWVALAAILLALLCGWFLWALRRAARHRRRLAADRAAKHMDHLLERLRHVRLVRSYLLDDLPGEPFDAKLGQYRRQALARDRAVAVVVPLTELLFALGTALLLFLSGINLLAQPPRLSITEMIVLYAAVLCIYRPLEQFLELRRALPAAESAARAVFHFLDREPVVGQPSDARRLARLGSTVEFDSVSLTRSNGRPLLDRAQLRLAAGSRSSIVSTDARVPRALAYLLVRLRDPAEGRVLFDGVDIRTATLESLRGQVAVVLPDSLLCTGSVADNIRFGQDRQEMCERVLEAAKLVEAETFIERLPQGFDTIVGDHGMRLEPLEAWQIGLARAVLRRPALLVVGEPELDYSAEQSALCDRVLERLAAGRTLIVLPARLATLRQADEVFVLHQGRLHAQGKHAELLQTSDLYRHVQYLRFNEFRREAN